MAAKTKGPLPQKTFYVKFYVELEYWAKQRHGRDIPNTADVDIPLHRLTAGEIAFLKDNTQNNWLFEQSDQPGCIRRVTLTLLSASADGPWNALRDYLADKVDW